MRIYELNPNREFTGQSVVITAKEGRPVNWIHSDQPPPETDRPAVAYWTGKEWAVRDEPLPLPVWEADEVNKSVLTVLQLRRLFTFEEKVAVEEAILQGNSALKVFMDDLAVATEVDLDDPLVEQGLNILVFSEIISEERKQQVLNNETPT